MRSGDPRRTCGPRTFSQLVTAGDVPTSDRHLDMDLIKKYVKNDFLFPLVSDYASYYVQYINEKPMYSILAPMTLIIFCYYIYIYVRKFYPISVNCWFCNTNFKVAFENRFEYTCIECGQFNGFKKDGSYTKTIPEQHNQMYNRKAYNVVQNDAEESKNGLCHKCNIIQEMKVKQLACFVPTNQKNFDWEIEKFKEQLENSLQLCSKCDLYVKRILSVQEQRYNLKSLLMNNPLVKEDVSNWPNVCSLCLSIAVFLLYAKNYLLRWAAQFVDTSIIHDSAVMYSPSIVITSLIGTSCQAYQCLKTMNKLNASIVFLWALQFFIDNFEIINKLQLKLVVSVFVILLSALMALKNMTNKPKYQQSSIALENKNYKDLNYCDTSKSCVSPKSRLRETHFVPGPTNEFIVRLPKFKVARVLNQKIFLEAIPESVQYTTRDEYDIDRQYMSYRDNVQMDQLKIATNQK